MSLEEAAEGRTGRSSPTTESRPPASPEVLPPGCPCIPLQGEVQSEAAVPPPCASAATSTVAGGGWQSSPSGDAGKSEIGRSPCPKAPAKPRISKVILQAVADKGMSRRVSLATLKKAVATVGYNMARNTWCFKRALKKLVDQGVLRQVTGRGALGSFCMGKKPASKPKRKAKRPRPLHQRPGQRRQPRRHRPGQHRLARQHRSRQHQALLGSKQGHRRVLKRAHRVAEQRHN